jgi:hypothetical protein
MVLLQRRLAAITLIATELATQYDALTRLRARVKRAEAAQSTQRRRRKRPRGLPNIGSVTTRSNYRVRSRTS